MDLNESPVREYQHFKSFIGSGILEDELLLPDPKKEDEEKITDIIPNQVLIPNHPKPREKNPRDKIILKLMSR